jgi:phosphoribosylamine--glycine ligase
MNILVLGPGGREHALCWRLGQDQSCQQIIAWPGNPGMESVPKVICVSTPFNKENLHQIIIDYRIHLVIPGAETFLYQGVADWCAEWQVPCLGPQKGAARLEESKLYSKEVMIKAQIPTARYEDLTTAFEKDPAKVKEILSRFKKPVIKISGPSLGKGVFVCENADHALRVLEEIKQHPLNGLEEGIFIEEAVEGEEISLFFACRGTNFIYLGAAQDHKRLLDGDLGPNTGGMGTVSPVHWVTQDFVDQSIEIFLRPTLLEMQNRGAPFSGVLFLGLMVNQDGANLLEYNVRFGDPETQVILPLIEGDLSLQLLSLLRGEAFEPLNISSQTAVHVVKAARGYPGLFGANVEKGQKIHLSLDETPGVLLFFAGVRKDGDELLTHGGRVLGFTSVAPTKEQAREKVYHCLRQARFEGEQFRTDIGSKA